VTLRASFLIVVASNKETSAGSGFHQSKLNFRNAAFTAANARISALRHLFN
jgi:hypothetical protein